MTKPAIIAFDPSKTTGWAYWDTDCDHSSIRCGLIEMPDKADHYYTGDQLGLKVQNLIKSFPKKPQFAVIEQQSLSSMGNNLDGVIYPWGAVFAISAICSNWGIPMGTIAPATWRNMFFPKGFKPPQKQRTVKGKIKLENDWKTPAVAECERMGIVLPAKKSTNHNAAEAAALAICWRGAKLHARRYEPAFMALLQQRNSKVAA
jgi:Holliday junction resolvasome RuvABC endonuclease subunit